MDSQCGTSTLVEVCLPVERHNLNTLIKDGTTKVSGTSLAVASSDDHTATTMVHIATNIVDVGTFNGARTAYHDVIGRVDTVAAGAVSTQQIVPAILVDKVGSLAVNGDIFLLVTLYTETCLGVEFDKTDGAKIGTVANPHTTCRRVEQYTWVNGILIFHTIAGADLDSC